jgi:hypothetical protein
LGNKLYKINVIIFEVGIRNSHILCQIYIKLLRDLVSG